MRSSFVLCLGLSLLVACGGDDDGGDDAPPTVDAAPTADAAPADAAGPPTVFGGNRPVTLRVPSTYQAGTPMPLVLALHGKGGNGPQLEELLNLMPAGQKPGLYETEGFLLLAPDGTKDSKNEQFWNATDACCDADGSNVDDEAYLMGLLDAVSAAYSVDPKRVYVMGFSNGAFMAYRLACKHADRVAAIVTLAGATTYDAAACAPAEKVSVLHIHGTKDATITFGYAPDSALQAVAGAKLVDGETFTIDDGVNPATVFELDSTGGVAAGRVAVPFTAGDGAPAVASAMVTAVNGVAGGLVVNASVGTAGTTSIVKLKRETAGTVTVSETVADAGFMIPDYDTLVMKGAPVAYPLARGTVDRWATYNGCAAGETSAAVDLTDKTVGAESTMITRDGCPAGVDVQLAQVPNGSHLEMLGLNDGADQLAWTFLENHPKP